MNSKEIIIIGFVFFFNSVLAQDYRYSKPVFDTYEVITDVVYGKANFLDLPYVNESLTTNKDLLMDIYLPEGEVLTNRPTIVFAHGGAFLSGKRDVDDMEAFCEVFAKKGYVTATIDYRLGLEVVDNPDLHFTRAVYRGIQDGRAAIRYLRANAETYGIDPDKIYWGGNSAGAIIGLGTIYLDNNEIPTYTNAQDYIALLSSYHAPNLGGLDIGDNLNFNGTPNGVMACWGAVLDAEDIDLENNTPVFLIHGTSDVIVPFNSGSPFNLRDISPVYGSNFISSHLNSIGISAEQTYFVQNKGHGFYGAINGRWQNLIGGNEYWDTIVDKSSYFFWQLHKPFADFTFSTNGSTVNFTDASAGATSWLWDFGDGNFKVNQNTTHTYSSSGRYKAKLYIENNIQSWDTISYEILIATTAIQKKETDIIISAYPNPFQDYLHLDFKSPLKQAIVQLYSSAGTLIYSVNNPTEKHLTLTLSHIKKGVYFVVINSEAGIKRIKIIKG